MTGLARRATVLIVADWFLPSTKAGGPVRSLRGLVESLGGEIRFRIVTRGNDLGDSHPYPDVDFSTWNRVGEASVRYLRPGCSYVRELFRIARTEIYDTVYLNSIFSPMTRAYLLLRRLRLVPPTRVILAPRGELGELALKLKGRRKAVFLVLARALGLFDGVIWSASSPFERDDIVRTGVLATRGIAVSPIVVAANIVRTGEPRSVTRPKQTGAARLVFLSRIDRKKNLDGALRMLCNMTGAIEYDIYGPNEDTAYLARCRALAAALPGNVRVQFRGEVPADGVKALLSEYDLFFLPTLNENFGHVIIEALLAGTPVLISDQTAWRGLEKHQAGWDLPLDDIEGFRTRILRACAMDEEELSGWRQGARRYAEQVLEGQQAVAAHRTLLLGNPVTSPLEPA